MSEIITPNPKTVLLHLEIGEDKNLSIKTMLKSKKDLINLLSDVIKIVNNREESNIIIPGGK